MKRLFIFILLVSTLISCTFLNQKTFKFQIKHAPPGSQVFLNGAEKGEIPFDGTLTLENIEPDKHYLRISLKGNQEFDEVITGYAGNTIEIIPAVMKLR